jgi:hypothetical protein
VSPLISVRKRLRAFGELDQHDANIFDHRQQHLAQILRLCRAFLRVAGGRSRADDAHPRDTRDEGRDIAAEFAGDRVGVERPCDGKTQQQAARIEAGSSLRPAMIVAVPSARSSAGSPSGIARRRNRSARTRAPRERRALGGGILTGEGVEPCGDRLGRGSLRRGVHHGDHGRIIRGAL